MGATLGARLKLALLIAGTLAVCAPGWSDAGGYSPSSNSARMCYCDCDAKPGSAMCTHMCELAKYENRSWAVSCHKAAASEPVEPRRAPETHSQKDNRAQQARR